MNYPTRIIIRWICGLALVGRPIEFAEVFENMCGMEKRAAAAINEQMLHVCGVICRSHGVAHVVVQIPSHAKLASSSEVVTYQVGDVLPRAFIPVPVKKPARLVGHDDHRVVLPNLR